MDCRCDCSYIPWDVQRLDQIYFFMTIGMIPKFRFRSVWWMHEVVEIDFKNQKVWLSDGDQRDITSGELMQFTWLLDKNGKEIYEWDIVKIEDECYGVYRDEGYLEYYIMNWESNEPMYSYAHYEVVGNIYENPELVNA